MRKLGAIDIGTNSIRALIAKVGNGRIIESFKDLETTRIGEGVDQRGNLSSAAMDRSIRALEKFVHQLRKEEGIINIPIIGTSALRDASNKDVFIKRAKEKMNVNIEVISGDREAQLGFLGVLKGMKEENKNILVIDIGGGSTEFIYGNSLGIHHLISLNMGAVRMTEKFIKTDPVKNEEIHLMIKEIDQIMKDTLGRLNTFKIDKLIGIGGTVTTIAAVSKGLEIYDREKIHGFDLNYNEVQRILETFRLKKLEDRKKVPGLHPKRADVITAGTIILDRILTLLEKDKITVSEYDNLEGMIFEQLEDVH